MAIMQPLLPLHISGGTNAIDKLFSTALKDAYGSSLSIESAKLTSDATGKEDYFKVDFTKAKCL